MAETLISDVSDTALWVAVYRAREGDRPDALFHDPLAGRLAGEKGPKIAAAMQGSQYTSWSIVIRTCIIDSFLKKLIEEGADTVLNLGAGLDTRPYRLDLPSSLRWIEVDYPHIMRMKDEQLSQEKPRCRLERVSLDLADRQARKKFFAEIASQSKKAVILTEGVVIYLNEDQVAELGKDLASFPSFQSWIVDYFDWRMRKYLHSRRHKREMKNAPFLFFPQDWDGFFKKIGWKVRDRRFLMDESERLGREVPAPWFAKILGFLFPKKMAKAPHRKFLGYVVLEPGINLRK